MSMFGNSINHIHDELEDLARLQEGALKAVRGEKDRLQNDRNSALKAVNTGAAGLIAVDDHKRFAQLTAVARTARTGDDFTALVAQWRAEDTANRTERADLEKGWGTRAEVAQKTGVQKEELDIVQAALKDVSPEIAAFDTTQSAIEAHNKKYPKAQITEENHDGFEVFKLGRFLLWMTFLNRGPHKAYQIIRPYNDQYGDFYEDMRDIAKLRQNELELKEQEDERQKAYDELRGIGDRMDTLDNSYKGPEGIARGVRKIVVDRVLDHAGFAAVLSKAIDTPETAAMALNALKVKAYDRISDTLDALENGADRTHDRISDAVNMLQGALWTVGSRSVYYDTDRDERIVENGIEVTRDALRNAERARDAIDEYRIDSNAELDQAEARIRDLSDLRQVDNDTDINFSELERVVRNEIAEYEEEQRRRREAERRAREEREAAARAARDLARSVNARRSGGSIGGSFNGSSHHSSIGGGNSGISGRSHGIGGGGRGINR